MHKVNVMKKSFILSFAIGLIIISSSLVFGQFSVGATLFEGGMKAYNEGRYSEAERLFRLVIIEVDLVEKERNPLAPAFLSDTLNALAGALHGQGKLVDAEHIILKQIQLLEKEKFESDSDFSQTSAALNNLGLLYAEQKKFKEAEETHRKAIRLREKYDGTPQRNLGVSLGNLGKVYYDQGKYLEAEPFFRQAQNIFLAIGPDNATDEDINVMLMASNNLGLIAVRRGQYKEAENRYLTVIRITEDMKGRNHPDLIQYLKNYSELLRLTKRFTIAKREDSRITLISKQK